MFLQLGIKTWVSKTWYCKNLVILENSKPGCKPPENLCFGFVFGLQSVNVRTRPCNR